MSFQHLLRYSYRKIRSFLRILILMVLSFFLRYFGRSGKIVIGYSALGRYDGLGAQLQRIIAVNGLARYWNLKIHHERFKQIATHPIDGFRNENEYLVFLKNVDFLVDAQDIDLNDFSRIFQIRILTTKFVLRVIFESIFVKGKVLLQTSEPYYFVDSLPFLYLRGIDQDMKERLRLFVTHDLSWNLVLHHRHGVGNMAIQPGQNKTREIPLDAYLKPIRKALQGQSLKLSIFTDAPEIDLLFQPPKFQFDSWDGLPGFDGETISVAPQSFDLLVSEFGAVMEIFRGGNPLGVIANMSTSKNFILSKSSFGYVAALFAESPLVFLPRDFWHPALPGWHTY